MNIPETFILVWWIFNTAFRTTLEPSRLLQNGYRW